LVRITAERFHGVQVDLTPRGAVELFGRPIADLAGRCVPLGELFGDGAVDTLVDRSLAAPGWAARFDLVDRVLVGRLGVVPTGVRAELTRVYDRLVATGGTAPVQDLARDVGWSRRHLTGQFRATFGIQPKALGRLIRFERAAGWLERHDRPDLATVAAMTGFADQAHLVRDVRAFSGLPPTQLAARYGTDSGGWWET
jgi:AraC-like DNA-binding protein